ncbi:MAG: hypothetical protein RIF33_13285 [Cyclobacteriaceae bacterium]
MHQIKYRFTSIVANWLCLLLLVGVPTGLHASIAQEESEIEVKTNHFQYTQERKGLILGGPKSKEVKDAFQFVLRDEQILETYPKTSFEAYLYYHQWLFYE